MEDYIQIFKPEESNESQESLIKGAIECLDNFGTHFNNEHIEGMDNYLHFPHYILSGNELIVWELPGQLPASFFLDLKKQGWSKTITQYREVILVSPNKVHFKVKYTREAADGNILSEHENVWILVYKNNKWGIVLRSY